MPWFSRREGREPRGICIRSDQGDELRRLKKIKELEPNLSELMQSTLDIILFGNNPTRTELIELLNKGKTEHEVKKLAKTG